MDAATPFEETPRGSLALVEQPVSSDPQHFESTPRGALAKERAESVGVEPVTFIAPGGDEYVSTSPGEINRLRLSRGYVEVGAPEPAEVVDNRFHPSEHGVDDVVAYIRSVNDNAPEVERVMTEEREGKNRPTVFSKLGQVEQPQ